MKTNIALLIFTAAFFSSCQKDAGKEVQKNQISSQQLMTTEQINAVIKDEIENNGEFNWNKASDLMLWSAIMHSANHTVSVGFKPYGEADVESRLGEINISDNKWQAAKNEVLQMIYSNEKQVRPSVKFETLEIWKEKKLPLVDVVIENINTLRILRNSAFVRYVEPMGYNPLAYEAKTDGSESFGSGCGGYNGATNLVEGKDYTTIAPGCKRSWNYTNHGIPNAWTKSTGAGIKVMVIDTGESPDQENMGSSFNQGYSSGS
jgi:hypothetical protein